MPYSFLRRETIYGAWKRLRVVLSGTLEDQEPFPQADGTFESISSIRRSVAFLISAHLFPILANAARQQEMSSNLPFRFRVTVLRMAFIFTDDSTEAWRLYPVSAYKANF